jgi:hypothetical protein
MSYRKVAAAQGAFFLATGLWPLVSLRSFEVVTGPKLEGWLVKGMGVVLSVIGASVVSSAIRDRVEPETAALVNGVGLGLGLVDVIYVTKRRIKPIYLADAVAEAGFALAWWAAHRRRRGQHAAG